MHLEILMRMHKRYRQTILGILLIYALLWGIIFLGGTYFDIPYQNAVSHSPNPWQPIPYETYPQERLTAIDFVDSTHGWLGGQSGRIYTTSDGGLTWQLQHTGGNGTLGTIDFITPQVGVAIYDINDNTKHVLITQNGGYNWTALELLEYRPIDIMILDEQTAWVLGTKGRFFSLDIQRKALTYISDHMLYLNRIFMLNNTYGWAVGYRGMIIHTQDGWQTYEQQASGITQDLQGIFFWDETIGWAVGFDRTILGTVDGGAHWGIQYSAPSIFGITLFHDIIFLTRFQGWATAGAGIYYTENGGQKWHLLPNTGIPQHIAFANQTHGWTTSLNKGQGRMTTVGGHMEISEQIITQNYAIFSFVGVLGIGIITIVGITLYYRQRKQRVLQSQSKLTGTFPKSEAPCDHSLSPQTNFCIHCGAKLSPSEDNNLRK
ncbi:MAG: WD40/YVTN/BNR-like repeat-containing protein [Promethearchaeota archaeon]